MIEQTMPIQWTEQQWRRVLQIVQDEAGKARVAARFLPVTGPLPPEQTTVPKQSLKVGSESLSIDEYETLSVVTLAVNVKLTSAQAAQPDLSSALTIFRKAAYLIATAEDALIFGYTEAKPLVLVADDAGKHIVHVTAGSGKQDSLHGTGRTNTDEMIKPEKQARTAAEEAKGAGEKAAPADEARKLEEEIANQTNGIALFDPGPKTAENLIEMTSRATGELGKRGHRGPYALILGNKLYDLAQTPNAGSLVLPSDRIKELLNGGQLLRLEILGKEQAVMVSTGGDPIEIVVASDIGVRFLQVTTDGDSPKYVYRVSERVVLRIKDATAVLAI
ncbi:MAG: encapsulin [Bryobacteraceae bacterium]